jgi:ribosome-binding protein aMBF1 (putative translation factor)
MKRDQHAEYVRERMKRSAKFRRAFRRSLKQVDMAMLVREMRDSAKLSQVQLAERAGTTQSVIARLEDAEYTAHSLQTLEKIAAACGVTLSLHAQKKPEMELEVSLV